MTHGLFFCTKINLPFNSIFHKLLKVSSYVVCVSMDHASLLNWYSLLTVAILNTEEKDLNFTRRCKLKVQIPAQP